MCIVPFLYTSDVCVHVNKQIMNKKKSFKQVCHVYPKFLYTDIVPFLRKSLTCKVKQHTKHIIIMCVVYVMVSDKT